MVKSLHDLKDPRLWYLRYIPYFGSCRILAISRSSEKCCALGSSDFTGRARIAKLRSVSGWGFGQG